MDVKIALIGAGNVGQGFLAVLRKKREQLASRHGITFQLVSVCDRSHGSVTAAAGLKISEILPILEDGRGLHRSGTEPQMRTVYRCLSYGCDQAHGTASKGAGD